MHYLAELGYVSPLFLSLCLTHTHTRSLIHTHTHTHTTHTHAHAHALSLFHTHKLSLSLSLSLSSLRHASNNRYVAMAANIYGLAIGETIPADNFDFALRIAETNK